MASMCHLTCVTARENLVQKCYLGQEMEAVSFELCLGSLGQGLPLVQIFSFHLGAKSCGQLGHFAPSPDSYLQTTVI